MRKAVALVSIIFPFVSAPARADEVGVAAKTIHDPSLFAGGVAIATVGVPLVVVGALSLIGGIGMAIEGGHDATPRVSIAPSVSSHGASLGVIATF